MNFFEKLRGIIIVDTTEIFLTINSIRRNEKQKPSKSNIYQYLKKDEKHKELEFEIFNQVIENMILSGKFFTKTHLDPFYILNGNIIIKNFVNIILM